MVDAPLSWERFCAGSQYWRCLAGASTLIVGSAVVLAPRFHQFYRILIYFGCFVQNTHEIYSLSWAGCTVRLHPGGGQLPHSPSDLDFDGVCELPGCVGGVASMAVFPGQTYLISRGIRRRSRPSSVSATRSRTRNFKIPPKPWISLYPARTVCRDVASTRGRYKRTSLTKNIVFNLF